MLAILLFPPEWLLFLLMSAKRTEDTDQVRYLCHPLCATTETCFQPVDLADMCYLGGGSGMTHLYARYVGHEKFDGSPGNESLIRNNGTTAP